MTFIKKALFKPAEKQHKQNTRQQYILGAYDLTDKK